MKSITPRNRSFKNQKENHLAHSPQPLSKQKNKQNILSQKNSKNNNEDKQSLKICLQLANHHKKEAEELKVKNDVLEYRLRQQLNDMQSLKKELDVIKTLLHQNQNNYKKEIQTLRQENDSLRLKINQMKNQNNAVRGKAHQTQSIIIGQSKSSMVEINPLTHAKQSRRQKYAHDYESISFVPSAVCFFCRQKDDEIIQQRQRYCNQLRQLQQQVSQLQRIQLIVGVMEQQLSDKNICIDFLRNQLDNFEQFSQNSLENIALLEQKLNKSQHNPHNRSRQTVMRSSLYSS